METRLYRIDTLDSPATAAMLREAAALLGSGQLVAFPTETVYGLGANALDDAACAAVYAVKGRPADNPMIVHIADIAMLYALAKPNALARQLAQALWPGPLTLVMEKQPLVPDIVSAGLPTVGVRWPSHPVAAALIQEAARPIAAPSANRSGRPSPTTATHVLHDMEGKIPLILDGGAVPIGLESTVVDVSGGLPVILRPGQIDAAHIHAACGLPVEYAGAQAAQRPAAPGMKYRHYAPQGELHLAADSTRILALRAQMQQKYGKEPLLIIHEETQPALPEAAECFIIARRGDMAAYARNLFAALRYADTRHYPAIIAETVPAQGLGLAIMNRLRKAAGLT